MKRSIRLLSSLTIVTGLIACADDGQTTRSSSSNSTGGTQAAENETESEVDYTNLDATFGISSATLDGLKDGNKNLEAIMARIQKDLDAVTEDCSKVSNRRQQLINALQPIAGELAALQLKSSSLGDLIRAKRKEHANKVTELATIKGDLAALKTQIANFNGDFKKKLAAAIAKIDSEVDAKTKELKGVEKAIDAVLAGLPFDSDRYIALDAKRDGLNDTIDQLAQERVQLKSALAAAARADLKALEAKRAAVQKLLDDKGPGLSKDISTLKAEVTELVKAKKGVDDEIGNDKDAQALKVPELPAGCVKLLAR